MTTAQDIAKKIESQMTDRVRQEIVDSTDLIFDSLVNHQIKGRLPESLFVNHFLDFFSGEKPATPDNKIIEQWISVAGTPMSTVDVINEKGDVLFNVPSLFETNMLDIAKTSTTNSLPEIYGTFDAKVNHIPAVGNKYLADALGDKIQNMVKDSPALNTNKQKWDEILTRYGKLEKSKSINSVKPDDDLADDMIYE